MFQSVRGAHDVLPSQALVFEHILKSFIDISKRYGYAPLQTPIFESTALFSRTLGETSDVVNKEMYTFQDRGGDFLTLRPEGTAALVRAAIQHGLVQNTPLKTYYHGPMFRYERPQKGRCRQFHQVGVECLGVELHPYADVDTIALGWALLTSLGLEKNVELHINTLGSDACRLRYKTLLVSYLEKYRGELSKDSQERLDKNPLRILDSKDEKDQDILTQAPRFQEALSEQSASYFQSVQEGLRALNIPFLVKDTLVRGLDYYTHTVFECVSTHLGAQGTVLAGGRYDHLVKELGGPDIAGIGFGAGIERLALLIENNETSKLKNHDVVVLPVETSDEKEAMILLQKIRHIGVKGTIRYQSQLSKRLKKEHRLNTRFALILGEHEREKNTVIIKDFEKSQQETLDTEMALFFLKNALLHKN
jgi:histidyl-tRNA synthetase